MIQNTTRVQIQSVINFLQELGYTYFPNDGVFESIGYETNKANKQSALPQVFAYTTGVLWSVMGSILTILLTKSLRIGLLLHTEQRLFIWRSCSITKEQAVLLHKVTWYLLLIKKMYHYSLNNRKLL